MSKDINIKPYDESTLTKLEIFERYIQAWLPVFIQTPYVDSAAIWDFFAGSGQDSGGVPGSPLRILRQINYFREQIVEKKMLIRILLNEEMKWKSIDLTKLVDLSRDQWSLNGLVTVDCRNEDFQVLFPNLYIELKRQPNLIFIDQYGIKHITKKIFKMLIELPKTDFLFFISSSSMKRFAKTPEFAAIFSDFTPGNFDNVRLEDVHRMMLDYYKRIIPPDNPIRLYPFTLRKGSNVYGLVFGSGHTLGVEKFLDLAWDQNQLNGEANFDIDDDIGKARCSLFPELRRLTKRECYERDLETFIRDSGEVTNRQIYEFTIGKGHPKAHAKECISRLRKEAKIDFAGQIGFSYKSCCSSRARIVTVKATDYG